MHFLLCYGYHDIGFGRNFERALSKDHQVTYCGLPYGFQKPGYSESVHLPTILKHIGAQPDVILYLDSG